MTTTSASSPSLFSREILYLHQLGTSAIGTSAVLSHAPPHAPTLIGPLIRYLLQLSRFFCAGLTWYYAHYTQSFSTEKPSLVGWVPLIPQFHGGFSRALLGWLDLWFRKTISVCSVNMLVYVSSMALSFSKKARNCMQVFSPPFRHLDMAFRYLVRWLVVYILLCSVQNVRKCRRWRDGVFLSRLIVGVEWTPEALYVNLLLV
jgi:hypothetical protein